MALPQKFTLHVINKLGAAVELNTDSTNNTIRVGLLPWVITAAGALEYGTETILTASSGADLSDGASLALTAFDNSTALDFGFHGWLELKSDITTLDGELLLAYEPSTDCTNYDVSAAGNFDAEQDLIDIASLVFDHDGSGVDTKAVAFEM